MSAKKVNPKSGVPKNKNKDTKDSSKNFLKGNLTNILILSLIVIMAYDIFFIKGADDAGIGKKIPDTVIPDIPRIDITAQSGDSVGIRYIGSFENGSMFDTNLATAAIAARIYSNDRPYDILEFELGGDSVIVGMSEAVIGMRIGQEKNVTIPTEKAYGFRDPEKIITVPREDVAPRFVNTTIEQFVRDVGRQPIVNMTVELADLQWPLLVVAVYNETVIVKHMPDDGMIVDTTVGTAVVEVRETEIIVRPIEPPVGKIISTGLGPAKVLDADDEFVLLDFNHILAGETVNFYIQLVSVNNVTA